MKQNWFTFFQRAGVIKRLVIMLSVAVILAAATVPVVMALYHFSSQVTKSPAPVVTPVASKTSSKPAAKTTSPTKPVQKTVAVTPPPTPPPTPTPVATPQPVAPSAPAPGSSIQELQPTPPPDTGSSSTDSSGSSALSDPSAPAAASGGYYSTNWSGYAALQGSFTSVSGSWVIPSVAGAAGASSGDAAWIGVGGVSSHDLIQTGTDDTVAPDGTVSSYAFYELLPDAALDITSLPVAPGNSMSATISEVTAGTWSISITNNTTGQNYTTTVQYASSNSSAEWIEEDPSYANGTLVPFDSFDHITFTGGSTTMNGIPASIAASNASPITLVDSNSQPLAIPSVLTDSGDGFRVAHQ